MLGKLIKNLVMPGAAASAADEPDTASRQVQQPQFVPAHTAEAYRGKIFITFIGESRSDGLAAGIVALADICRAGGYDYRLIDVRKESWRAELMDLMKRPEEICCVFASMAAGFDWIHSDGVSSFWRAAGVPFVGGMGDHPAYFWDRHLAHGPGFANMYIFQEHVDAVLAWSDRKPQVGILRTWPRDAVDKQKIDFKVKESGKIYFFKNGNSPKALLDFWRSLPPPMSDWLMELSHSFDMLKVGRGLKPLHELVASFLVDRGFYPGPAAWIQVFMVAQLDDYARRVKATLMAEAMLDLPVHIFGDNWGHVDFTGRRATHHQGQSYFVSRGLVSDALAVVDMSPNTESAPHERFACAMGRHTLCLTNTQQYYLDNYADAEQMLFEFDVDSLKQKVADVLGRPRHYVDFGVAVAEHGWKIHPPSEVVKGLADFARMTRFAGAASGFVGQQNFIDWPPRLR